ncbi:MAG: mechanosensitive ion channel domain-containing protein [Anaerolineales bacterium]
MPVLLLSILVLMFSWTAAHLFAVPTTYFVRATHLYNIPVLQALSPQVGKKGVSYLRKLVFAAILILLGMLLAAVLGIQPIYLAWKDYIQDFVDFELTQTLMSGLLDNVMLALGIFVVFQTITFVNEFFPRLYELLEKWRHTRFHVIRFRTLELVTPDQITDGLISLVRTTQIGLNLVLGLTGLTFALSFFPGTHGFISGVIDRLGEMLMGAVESIIGYLPNLFTLILIVIVTRYTLKLLRFFHEGINSKKIKVAGLHPELTEPTFQLLRFMIVTLALVAAYPFLPGSDSPVFRGITIFVGFLLSLGSTSLVTNIVSGIVLTYTRGLRIGDRVKIGATVGDVLERTMLVTRIRTIKNVVVTIPNGMVLNNEIINYNAPMLEEGLILNTTVTIGYDVPWRKVHDLLIQAALATRDIQSEQKPFVLQTSLDDYYVSYELNAYTHAPERMAVIYSELHQNIQDWFNEAGVEIMSPGYTALREGDEATIPAQYRSHGPVPIMMPERFGKVDTTPANKLREKMNGNGLFP